MYILLGNIFENCILTSLLHFFRVAGYWKCSNKTPIPLYIWIGLVNTLLRLKTWQWTWYFSVNLIALDYYFFFYISQKYLQFRRKTKAFVKENFWFASYKQNGSSYGRIIFQTTQRYVHNLEWN